METEPVVHQQFQAMSFNPFLQQFSPQQQEQLMMQQQLINQQQQSQQDEEMEMADDTSTCDMKYSENDMNQMNVTMNSISTPSVQNNAQKNHEEQLLQQLHSQQFNHQQKFGRLSNESDFIKKDKLLDEEESYDESDEEYDEEEDDLDDDDCDEHLVHEMMMSAAPEVQNIIKLIVSGFSTCASEVLRYLVGNENLAVDSPMMVGLIDYLKTQETFLIVNYLKNLKQTQQQYQQQLIKQHQQQILASQLMGKQIDPKMINQLQAQQQSLQQQQQQQQKKTNQQLIKQQQQIHHLNQQHKQSSPNQSTNQSPIPTNTMPNNLTNSTGGSLSPSVNGQGPLTSSPINKPFDQLNSINVNNLNHLSNFTNTLHSAFGGSQSSHSNVNSAQNSQSNSPIHTPPLHLTNNNFNLNNQQQLQQPPNPFSNPANNSSNKFSTNNAGNTFFNQTPGVLSSFKQQPFNDSGFSE